jgi:hypothetical protein
VPPECPGRALRRVRPQGGQEESFTTKVRRSTKVSLVSTMSYTGSDRFQTVEDENCADRTQMPNGTEGHIGRRGWVKYEIPNANCQISGGSAEANHVWEMSYG